MLGETAEENTFALPYNITDEEAFAGNSLTTCTMTDDGVVPRLFNEGRYEHILWQIFWLLDGASLENCVLVCKQWRDFVKTAVAEKRTFRYGVNLIAKDYVSTLNSLRSTLNDVLRSKEAETMLSSS